ncbi:MAG TPA: hypothetical protein DFS52_21295 [Myxococcales bacterium]|nr:hypothetical protein [Myxococcales bacterium]
MDVEPAALEALLSEADRSRETATEIAARLASDGASHRVVLARGWRDSVNDALLLGARCPSATCSGHGAASSRRGRSGPSA